MYREEFTRQWYEDQIPNQTGNRQPPQHGGSDIYRKSQYNGRAMGNNNYLSNGVPLPVQTESGLHGPAIRKNPIFHDNIESSFLGDDYVRRNYAASDNLGFDNQGYSSYNQRRWNGRPYDTSSAVADTRTNRTYMYKGKTPSELGNRPANWQQSPQIDNFDRHNNGDYRRNSTATVNSMAEYNNIPSWVKSLGPSEADGPENFRRHSNVSKGSETYKNEMSTGYFVAFRLIIMCLAVWDLVNDWLLTSSVSIFEKNRAYAKCLINNKINFTHMNNMVTMCGDVKNVWTLAAVFSLLGSLLTVLQVINMVMEIIKKRRPYFFQILQGQSEICFVMFFEELPQCILFTVFFLFCDCTNIKSEVNTFSLMASISACMTMTLRYASSFETISGESGCCNLWWRCCCCRNTKYFCRLQPKECCCTCDMPCPLCCCTLGCNMCRYTPKTWCTSLMKAFSCFCGCCSTENDSYGIKIMNNISLLILWACLGFQIFIFYSTNM